MDNVNDLLTTQQFAEESLTLVAFNLFLCILLVSFVGWFYKKYSRSLGGKTHVGSILPLIGLTVFMVITVVKSSLALSLGLVGALSIVRFRTPIKARRTRVSFSHYCNRPGFGGRLSDNHSVNNFINTDVFISNKKP